MASTKPRRSALRKSLFTNVPPSINFVAHNEQATTLPMEIRRHMKWKMSSITPLIVRRVLTNSNFRMTKKNTDWVGQWGKHMKSIYFKLLSEHQKINHFPGTFVIGRKDRLWVVYSLLREKYGRKEFGYLPETYILPGDMNKLKAAWDQTDPNIRWILKPPASARGTGIQVIGKMSQLPSDKEFILQSYVNNPRLINGHKFDIRMYVLVCSFNPLRIYIYEEGFARFASEKYNLLADSLENQYVHLTNFSINKNSSAYIPNDDVTASKGHKWTLKVLFKYLNEAGVNVDTVWGQMVDIVIKTCISAEPTVQPLNDTKLKSLYSCYELFGFDVMLDDNLKLHLLEVNISPSLHSTSVLDIAVKGPLVRDILNMASFHIPPEISPQQKEKVRSSLKMSLEASVCLDDRMYVNYFSQEEIRKHTQFEKVKQRSKYLDKILEHLTPDDVRMLIRSEDELHRRGRMIRVYPTVDSHRYHKYFDAPRYYNMLFDAWETKYSDDRKEGRAVLDELCKKMVHVHVSSPKY